MSKKTTTKKEQKMFLELFCLFNMLLSYVNCVHLYRCDNEALKIKLLHLDMIILLREKKKSLQSSN